MIAFLKNKKLPKSIILRKKKEIQETFKNSRRYSSKKMNIYFFRKEGDPRVAFFVKKKIGKAVIRNRSKRLIREYYRNHKKLFRNIHIIFVIKSPILSMQEVEENVRSFIHDQKNFGFID